MREVVIVGGGLAGSAAAIPLARAGREVTLLERDAQPQHKVCGEFLSADALGSLAALGVDVEALGARSLKAVRLADARRVTESRLPFAAMSLTRRVLDEALLQEAERCGVRVERGARVLRVEREGAAWQVRMDGREAMSAKTVFVATGKHDVGGRVRPQGVQRGMVGFKMYFALEEQQAAELAGHIELMLFRGGYAGLQLVEDGSANLGWIVQRAVLQGLGGYWNNVLAVMMRDCPQLARRLHGAEKLMERPLAVSSIPYGYVRREAEEGVWSVGDQAAVIPSFTGDGMAIALHSGMLAARMYGEGSSAEEYQRRLHGQLRRQVRLATVVSRGMVSPVARRMLMATARPGALAWVAKQTRLKEGRG